MSYADIEDEVTEGAMNAVTFILDDSGSFADDRLALKVTGKIAAGYELAGRGEIRKEGGGLYLKFYAKYGSYTTTYYEGEIPVDCSTFTVKQGYSEQSSQNTGLAILSKTRDDYLRFRPAPVLFKQNTAKSLWTYCRRAILADIQRQRLSWSWFLERRNIRNTFLRLGRRYYFYGRPLDNNDLSEFKQARQLIRTADARFYFSLLWLDLQDNPRHRSVEGSDQDDLKPVLISKYIT
jgi:hypothetical protein